MPDPLIFGFGWIAGILTLPALMLAIGLVQGVRARKRFETDEYRGADYD